MNAKFRDMSNTLNALVTFKADKSMSDDDFIANVDAINVLCNLYDDLGLDRSEIRRKMNALYPEFSRRIHSKENIQLAMPLIKALYRYIYGRGVDDADRGPVNRRKSFIDMCHTAVAAYREKPLIHSSDYLYALCAVTRSRDYIEKKEYQEINEIIVSYLRDIDSVATEGKLIRLTAYNESKEFICPDNNHWEKWAEIRELLKQEDISQLDDEDFLIWCEVTDESPRKELKRRAGNSRRMQVEHLRTLIFAEFKKQRHLAARRKLSRELKRLNDDLIGDIIPLKINSDMSVSTLYALETIFYLRLQLAQVAWEDSEPIYESLCRDRFEQINKALAKKYKVAKSINEKIEILERLEVISQTLHNENLTLALDEASSLEDLPGLTYAQKLRLEWFPNINSVDDSKIVAQLLSSSLEGRNGERLDSFVMATIGMLIDYITDEERAVVLDRYIAMVNAAIAINDAAELGNLLALAAYWNSNPSVRHRLSDVVDKATSLKGVSLPEKRVNAIAAEIYARIDAITGKYEDYDYIPA